MYITWILASVCLTCSASASPADEQGSVSLQALKAFDVKGELHLLGNDEKAKAFAIVFLNPECPISNAYLPTLNSLATEAESSGVHFMGVVSDVTMTREKIVKHAEEYKITFPVLVDAVGEFAAQFEPSHVPEAFVLDRSGRVTYRGRVDDQYAQDLKRRAVPRSFDLKEAMLAVAKGVSPQNARTEPVGCKFESERQASLAGNVTYHRHIAAILKANCVECHRAGEVAPFAFEGYEDAAKRAEFLVDVTQSKRMPPWKTREGYGHFVGERRLSPREIQALADWTQQGAPKGDPADEPPTRSFVEGWKLGEPDLVISMQEEFKVAASGPDAFRFFVIPIDIPEDKVVAAVEFRPGNPRVVHHAVLYLDRSGKARERDNATPEPGYEGFLTGGFQPSGVLGFWAPGYTPRPYPEGVGQTLYPKTDLAMQLHYHPNGKEELDRSMVGVHFADKPLEKRVGGAAMIDFAVNIPPGEKEHRMDFTFTTPVDMEIIDVTPHMHLIGREMKVTATKPDGTVVPMIWIDWDFNWQDVFHYREPVKLPAGTRFDMVATFDNSDQNPYNPSSPPKRILFGEQTTDEMCICAFRTVEKDGHQNNRLIRRALQKSMMEQLKDPVVAMNVTRFIANGNGDGVGLLGNILRNRAAKEQEQDSDTSAP